jgi:hypothetical protein
MTGPGDKTRPPLFFKFIADCEERTYQQLIADLDQQGLSTARAMADLKRQEASLRRCNPEAIAEPPAAPVWTATE